MARDRPIPTWRVTARRLRQLLQDVQQGKRIYEVLVISRPRDLIPYLDVVVTSGWDVLAEYAEQWNSATYNAKKMTADDGLLMKPIPYWQFVIFTQNYELGQTWLGRVKSKPFRKFVRKLISLAQHQARQLRTIADPLIQADVQAFDQGTHLRDQADLELGIVSKATPTTTHFSLPTWRITATRLGQLLKDTQQGCRIYEVLAISRPGDVTPYLDVVVTSGWDVLAECAGWKVKNASAAKKELEKPIRYKQFTSFIKNHELSQAWLARVRGKPFHKFVRKLMALAQRQAAELRATPDPLTQVDVRAFDQGTHQWDQAWLDSAGAGYPKSPLFHRHYSDAFYHALECLLALPAINSFAHMVVTQGDYRTLQLACLEQQRRGGPSAFPVHGSYDWPPFDHGMDFDNEAYRVFFPNIPQWFYEALAFREQQGRHDLRLTDEPVSEAFTKVAHFKAKIRKILLYSFSSECALTGFCGFNHPAGWSVHIREELPDLKEEILMLFPDLVPCSDEN